MRAIHLTDAQHRAMTDSKAKLAHRRPLKPKAEPPYVGVVRAFCASRGFTEPFAEAKFLPMRRFKFDLAWFKLKIAVEVEGGIFQRRNKGGHAGWHQSVERMLSDMEKYNEAALRGWMVLRVTPRQIDNGAAFVLIERAMEERRP